MTTSLSTANPPSGAIPDGLPDVEALGRLANQFFRALPAAGAATEGLPAPGAAAPIGTTAPTALADAIPAPVNSTQAPLGTGAPGGVPGTPLAPIPGLDAHAPSLPSPTELGRGLPSGAGGAHGLAAGAPPGTGLPGFPNVAAPFTPIPPIQPNPSSASPHASGPGNSSGRPASPGEPRAASSSSFYFLDFTHPFDPGRQGIAVPGLVAAEPAAAPAGRLQSAGLAPLDAHLIRRDFPILNERVNGKPLVWLDNAATTQKPRQVIERLRHFYEHENSNIHRAAHTLAARATDAYEAAREKVRHFINARSTNEVIFVRGATEAINLVAKSWGQQFIGKDDEILVSNLEHHANIVPWQQLAALTGARIRVIPVDDTGQIRLDEYARLLGPKTKLVSFTQVSNALGTVTPAQQMVAMAHGVGARVLVDGAQSVSHMPVDVISLDADWFVFSGHKVFGPTGIGVLYGKEDLLNETEPWQGGGNMIEDVTFEHTRYHKAPGRFEAGTGNIADAVGLGAAIDYVTAIGMEKIAAYEHGLLEYGTYLLKGIAGLRLIGTAAEKAGVLSFVLEGFKTEEVGAALSQEGIAVRSGHHCAQPILRRFGVEATVRPSLAFYNTCAELDLLAATVHRLRGRKSSVAGGTSFGEKL